MSPDNRGACHKALVGQAGFTLIELLLAVSLFVMITSVVFAAFSGS